MWTAYDITLMCSPIALFTDFFINVTVGITGRTISAPISAHRLIVDKVEGLRSGILTYTNLVLLQINVEMRVKVFI